MLWSARSVIVGLGLCPLLAITLQAQKAACTFKTFVLNPADLNSPREYVGGANDNSSVVGMAAYPFDKPNIIAFAHHADDTIRYWRPSGSRVSEFSARNNLGNTVGGYADSSGIFHAVYLHGSTVTEIIHPKAANHSTDLVGINKYNTILGKYSDSNGHGHVFKRYSNGSFVSIPNFPGATSTSPSDINDNAVIVGNYNLPTDGKDIAHGFIYHNGTWATLNYRNKTTATYVAGISGAGTIVGDEYANGFLYKNGVFKDIVGPNGEQVTVRGISPGGIISGDMWISASGSHGFTAKCH